MLIDYEISVLMSRHAPYGEPLLSGSLKHMRVAPLDAGVVYRTEDERENAAYIDRRERSVDIFESYRYAVLADPVVEYDQQRSAQQY